MRADFDWGPEGARALAPAAAIVAVVDVLSFTTTLTVAADRGIAVRPYRWRDATAQSFARDNDAVLAAGRTEDGPVSLSPATIRRSTGIARLVLPSPNGATISALLGEQDARVIGVSLRNAPVAATWVRDRLGPGATVAVIAAGERRPGGGLRPAVEDLWGAGCFLHHLVRATAADLTVEAGAALAAYEKVSVGLPLALRDCVSGRELRDHGFPEDVEVAAEAGASAAVPVLTNGWYVADSVTPTA
ncbi:2-phosphosulfolactate phosphatase [Actinoplanes sp. N902-109]|uniref:2-phosphosulfolactate phosphatase n=1 Tax=Actinoplanes sp. (strain N902-109) TaxID=649831 RepID=UPI0012FA27AB|nr:2-phosphosulfolactate phosphatase [Actinoplanes sp. N902-109]